MPKPIPGSTQTDDAVDPRGLCGVDAFDQEPGDLVHDVVVRRLVLHRPRLTLHVHQHDPDAAVGDDVEQLGVDAPRGDVVDDGRTGIHGCHRDCGLRRVDAHGHIGLRRQARDDGDDPAELLGRVDGLGPGPRRLAAHVEEVGAGVDQRETVLDRSTDVEEPATVGERVRSDVHDPHDQRPRGAEFGPPEHGGERTGIPRSGPWARGSSFWRSGMRMVSTYGLRNGGDVRGGSRDT